MITLYSPATGANIVTQGTNGVSPQMLELNILIELRVANQLALELAQGNVNVTLEALRADAVNDALPATV